MGHLPVRRRVPPARARGAGRTGSATPRRRRRRLSRMHQRRRRVPLDGRPLAAPCFRQAYGTPDGCPARTARALRGTGRPTGRRRRRALMLARVERAVRAVPDIGRVHVCRWGDGGEHLHWWFMARPARFPQLIGSFAAVWDEVLPPLPEDVWRDNLAIVKRELEASG